jgi:hypothetical protein
VRGGWERGAGRGEGLGRDCAWAGKRARRGGRAGPRGKEVDLVGRPAGGKEKGRARPFSFIFSSPLLISISIQI